MAEKISSLKIAEAYDQAGYARLVRADNGSLYLVCEHWCGGDIEGMCFRDFFALVPPACEAEAEQLIANADWRGVRELEGDLGSMRLSRAQKAFRTEILAAL